MRWRRRATAAPADLKAELDALADTPSSVSATIENPVEPILYVEPPSGVGVQLLGPELDALLLHERSAWSPVFITRELFGDLQLNVAEQPTVRSLGGTWEVLMDVDVAGAGFTVEPGPELWAVFFDDVDPRDPRPRDQRAALRVVRRDYPLPEYQFRFAVRNKSGADLAPTGNTLIGVFHGVRPKEEP